MMFPNSADVNSRTGRALSLGQKIDRWMVNEGKRRIFVGVLFALHLLVFVFGLVTYAVKDNFVNARSTLGITFPIARAAALVLHFDIILILLPVCRNLMSFLRGTGLGSIIPFDKNITFHKFIAWSVVLFSWIHTIAHWNNFAQLSRSANLGFKGWLLLNFTTGPGITGYLMLVILMGMMFAALEKARRKNFERFWYTHHLFILFFLLWQVHGLFCMITPDRAPFCGNVGTFWRYWLVGGTIYLFERILREVRGRQRTSITKVIQHPSRVCEIQIRKDHCDTKAGQYIFLCCPEISLHQYHPFTLTSAPEEDYISIHMRCVGDFTNALAKSLGCDFSTPSSSSSSSSSSATPTPTSDAAHRARSSTSSTNKVPRTSRQSRIIQDAELDSAVSRVLPTIMIDGPFGSASEDVFTFETVMLVGAGIGVTPFASILKSIWYRIHYPQSSSSSSSSSSNGGGKGGGRGRLGKVYFFWICRDFESFEWFRSLLTAIEQQDVGHMIEIHAYLTAKIAPDVAQNIIINNGADAEVDAVMGLRRTPVNFGRPAWDDIFASLATLHPASDVGVFFCGPAPLGSALHRHCNAHSAAGPDGTRFVFGKENF